MIANKFVGYFLEQVTEWQNKLSTADSVITIWFEVQVTWSHLESIFIGSEDIRAQLPEHSKQFDTIDADFKVGVKLIMIIVIIFLYSGIIASHICVSNSNHDIYGFRELLLARVYNASLILVIVKIVSFPYVRLSALFAC